MRGDEEGDVQKCEEVSGAQTPSPVFVRAGDECTKALRKRRPFRKIGVHVQIDIDLLHRLTESQASENRGDVRV